MGSDALSVYNFINGTTYMKYVPDLNHASLNSGLCNHVGTHLRRDGNLSEVDYEEVECFERDPIWGFMSLFFIFFPFFVLTVKTIGLLNPGRNWKILARRCAFAEGVWESRFQLLLQLFIIFTRADRAPSLVQMLAMASSE